MSRHGEPEAASRQRGQRGARARSRAAAAARGAPLCAEDALRAGAADGASRKRRRSAAQLQAHDDIEAAGSSSAQSSPAASSRASSAAAAEATVETAASAHAPIDVVVSSRSTSTSAVSDAGGGNGGGGSSGGSSGGSNDGAGDRSGSSGDTNLTGAGGRTPQRKRRKLNAILPADVPADGQQRLARVREMHAAGVRVPVRKHQSTHRPLLLSLDWPNRGPPAVRARRRPQQQQLTLHAAHRAADHRIEDHRSATIPATPPSTSFAANSAASSAGATDSNDARGSAGSTAADLVGEFEPLVRAYVGSRILDEFLPLEPDAAVADMPVTSRNYLHDSVAPYTSPYEWPWPPEYARPRSGQPLRAGWPHALTSDAARSVARRGHDSRQQQHHHHHHHEHHHHHQHEHHQHEHEHEHEHQTQRHRSYPWRHPQANGEHLEQHTFDHHQHTHIAGAPLEPRLRPEPLRGAEPRAFPTPSLQPQTQQVPLLRQTGRPRSATPTRTPPPSSARASSARMSPAPPSHASPYGSAGVSEESLLASVMAEDAAAATVVAGGGQVSQSLRFVYFLQDHFVDPLPPPPPIMTVMSPFWGAGVGRYGEHYGTGALGSSSESEQREFLETQTRSLYEHSAAGPLAGQCADKLPPPPKAQPPAGYTRSPPSGELAADSLVCVGCSAGLMAAETAWYMRRCGHVYCRSCSLNMPTCRAKHCQDRCTSRRGLFKEIFI